jgi:hypothetical protein
MHDTHCPDYSLFGTLKMCKMSLDNWTNIFKRFLGRGIRLFIRVLGVNYKHLVKSCWKYPKLSQSGLAAIHRHIHNHPHGAKETL